MEKVKLFRGSFPKKIRSQYKTEAERSADTMALLYETVGVELKALDVERQKLANERSWLKKFFDKLVDMDSKI